MAYATVALVQTGHLTEAKAALAFQMNATSGTYQQYVGAPYQISVVRYYGNGTEWSDSNTDGPNIEFDGFGLFLWALDTYIEASNDTATLATWWPVVGAKVGDVLVQLQEPTGLISADSSIWEVHWDGQQRHFAYTTIAAANGLCAASRLATKANDATRSATYLTAGQKARDALLPNLRGPDGTLAQSTEGLATGSGWLDAAVVESINFGLIDPMKRTARATLASMQNGLVPQSGRGFMRSDAGDSYSSNEWVFVDLRAERSLELHGDATGAASLFAWNVDQTAENFGEFSELHDPVTANYAGQSPMVGFGAGAYALSLSARGTPVVPTCGGFASEPADPVDAGPEGGVADAGADASQPSADGGGGDSGGAPTSDGGTSQSSDDGSSGGCASAPGGSGGWSVAFAAFTLWLAARRRKR
jgi:GH15 family glucan-1,4-alpha-glucosidase